MKNVYKLTLSSKIIRNFLFVCVWCLPIWYGLIRGLLLRIPILGLQPDIIIVGILTILIILSIRYLNMRISDIIMYLVVLAVYLISPIIFPDTEEYWYDNALYFLTSVLPMYFMGLYIGQSKDDTEKIISILYKASVITIIVRIAYWLGSNITMSGVYESDMSTAYKLLPHVCMVTYHMIQKMSFSRIFIWLVGSAFLLFQGTRGAVLIECIVFLIMVYLYSQWKNKAIKISLIAIALVAFLYSPLFEIVVRWLYQVAEDVGLSVRIFDSILNGNLTVSKGREVIINTLYDILKENPWGNGIYADWVYTNSYAHNMCLELWIQYGIIIGTVLFAFIILTPIRAFIVTKCQDMRAFFVILYCTSVIKLFLSSSYLLEPSLFLLIGLSISLIRQSKKVKKSYIENETSRLLKL